jgi:hypothetical protein
MLLSDDLCRFYLSAYHGASIRTWINRNSKIINRAGVAVALAEQKASYANRHPPKLTEH